MLKYFSNELLSANWYIPVGYLARLMLDEINFIASGYSARPLLLCPHAPPRYLNLYPSGDNKLAQILGWLYAELEQLPEPITCFHMKPRCYFRDGIIPWSMLRLKNRIMGFRVRQD